MILYITIEDSNQEYHIEVSDDEELHVVEAVKRVPEGTGDRGPNREYGLVELCSIETDTPLVPDGGEW